MILTLLVSAALAAPTCLDTSVDTPLSANESFVVSADGSFAYNHGYQQNSFMIIDLSTGEITTHPKAPSAYLSEVNGQLALTIWDASAQTPQAVFDAVRNSSIKVINPKTGQTREERGKISFRGGLATPVRVDGSNVVVKDRKGKEWPVFVGNDRAIATLSGDREDAPFVTHNRETGKVKIETTSGGFELESPDLKLSGAYGELTPDHKYYLFRGNHDSNSDGSVTVLDIENKTVKKISYPQGHYLSSPNATGYNPRTGDLLLTGGTSGGLSVNLKEGRTKTLVPPKAGKYYDLKFNSKGELCNYNSISSHNSDGTVSGRTQRFCAPLGRPLPETGETLASTLGSYAPLTDTAGILNAYGWNGAPSANSFMLKSEICVSEVPVDCNCEIEKPTNSNSNIEDLKSLALATACSMDYKKDHWQSLTPANPANLSEGQAVIWMKKFSKPGALDLKKDLGILMGILNSKFSNSYPGLTKSVLRNLMLENPRLLDTITKKYPQLTELKAPFDESCLTTEEKSKLQNETYVRMKSQFERVSTFDQLKKMTLLGKDSLNPQQKEVLAEMAADRMTEQGNSGVTAGVFASKIFKFSHFQFQKLMGLSAPDITDFTVVRTPNEMRILQLGREPFTGSKESPSGIHVREIGRINVADIRSDSRVEKYKWKYGGKDYVGELSIDKIAFDESYMPANKAPDYKDMWRDKEMRTVVVAGSNLGTSLTQSTMNQYVAYYMENGFTFDAAKDNNDMLSYLKEKVSGQGQMDYFIKEAHSGGDEKTMFDIAKKGKVMIGRKKVGDRTEVVELIYPQPSVGETIAIGNSEFGQWTRDRVQKGGSELVYLNTSCWSETKAIYEIPAAANAKYVNIPTTTLIHTFVNRPGNVMKILVDGLRQEKSYEQVREMLKGNRDYAEGKGNKLLFPDEADYRTRIVDRVRAPFELNSRVMVKNSSGEYENYNIGVH